jgi:hypothetical protein
LCVWLLSTPPWPWKHTAQGRSDLPRRIRGPPANEQQQHSRPYDTNQNKTMPDVVHLFSGLGPRIGDILSHTDSSSLIFPNCLRYNLTMPRHHPHNKKIGVGSGLKMIGVGNGHACQHHPWKCLERTTHTHRQVTVPMASQIGGGKRRQRMLSASRRNRSPMPRNS